jgi:hypothetical protein
MNFTNANDTLPQMQLLLHFSVPSNLLLYLPELSLQKICLRKEHELMCQTSLGPLPPIDMKGSMDDSLLPVDTYVQVKRR